MTDDEEAKRMAELVEKVALAIADAYYRSASNGQLTLQDTDTIPEDWAAEARAAIAVLRPLVLEEAAGVAEEHMNPFDIRFGGDGIEIAAAIRALIETPKAPQGDE